MTLATTLAVKRYAGDGTTTAFPTVFTFLENSHVQVVHRTADGLESAWLENTHYSLSGAGSDAGGTLTVITSPDDYTPALGETIVLQRVVPLTQETDYPEGGAFPAATHEGALDLSAMRDQQISEDVLRALRIPVSDADTIATEIPSSIERANKYLAFDSSATPIAVDAASASGTSVTATGSTTARLLADRFGDVRHISDWGPAGDGINDDRAKIQAAIDAAKADGGGTIVFDSKTYALSDELVVDHSNIRLIGQGSSHYAALGAFDPPSAEWAAHPKTSFKAMGGFPSGQGLIKVWTHPAKTGVYANSGITVQGIYLDCDAIAEYGLKVFSVKRCFFRDITVARPEIQGVRIYAFSPPDHATYNKAVQFCEFDNIHVRCDHDQPNMALGFFLGGTNDANVNYCTFRGCRAIHDDGHGFFIDNADSNLFLYTFGFAQGSGMTIWLDGCPDDTNVNVSARNNLFVGVQCATGGLGGIRVKAGTDVAAGALGNPHNNEVIGFSSGNGGVAASVTVDDGIVFSFSMDEDQHIWNAVEPTLFTRRTHSFVPSAGVGRWVAQGKLGSGTEQDFGIIHMVQAGTSGSETSRWDFETYRYNGGGLKRRCYIGDGVVIEHDEVAPAGGDKGGGTLNMAGPLYLNNIPVLSGAGSPEGAVVAPVGALYLRTDGGTASTGYLKESGSGNTGWAAI